MQLYSVRNTSPGRKDPDAPFLHPVRDASLQDAGLEGTTVLPKDTFLTECKICEMQAKLIIIVHYLFLVPK